MPALSLRGLFLTVTFCATKTLKCAKARHHAFPTFFLLAIMGDERLLASLDLMRRMPPSRMENSLEGARDRRASARIFQSKHLASHGARLNTSQHL